MALNGAKPTTLPAARSADNLYACAVTAVVLSPPPQLASTNTASAAIIDLAMCPVFIGMVSLLDCLFNFFATPLFLFQHPIINCVLAKFNSVDKTYAGISQQSNKLGERAQSKHETNTVCERSMTSAMMSGEGHE
ncbi:hypothetical protein [Burkholderia cepacia]|uniref:hypothetical protein n=1 Tax=Burkholderia cepacia TaxID=292 RepID=UPI00215896DD|nr:hypothetical protein [Burkholderia cepacia]